MGLFGAFGVKIDLKTKQGIEKLEKVSDFNARKRIVKKCPEVVLYTAKSWSKQKEDFKNLVFEALVRKPEIITGFKGKDGLVVSYEYVKMAVLSDPMVIAKMNDEMRELITPELFIEAFVKNPLVLSIKDLKVLKHKVEREVKVYEKSKDANGKPELVDKKIKTSLRNECLKAIRLSECTSRYHEGYDDFALEIAKKLNASKEYKMKRYSSELLSNFATLMNAMIKKENQQLRAVSAEAWLVNKGKPMYKAMRTSSKKDSDLEGLISDMPTSLLPEKVVKKLIITAVLTNPEFYLKLGEYGFANYADDATVKYNVYKSLKKHGMLKKVENYLDQDDIKKSKGKLTGVEKRQNAKKQPKVQEKEQPKTQEQEQGETF